MSKFLFILFILLTPYPSFANNSTGSGIAETCFEITKDNVEASECLSQMAEKIEAELTKIEGEALEAAKKEDEEWPSQSNITPNTYKYREASKKAFEQYMNAECKNVMVGYQVGSLAGHFYDICRINLMTERLERLKR